MAGRRVTRRPTARSPSRSRIGFRVLFAGDRCCWRVGWIGLQLPAGAGGQRRPWCCGSGASSRVQQAGLLLAWPRPIEQVVLLPGATASSTLRIAGDGASAGLTDGSPANDATVLPEAPAAI